jgi:hypothetical protein
MTSAATTEARTDRQLCTGAHVTSMSKPRHASARRMLSTMRSLVASSISEPFCHFLIEEEKTTSPFGPASTSESMCVSSLPSQ